MNKKVILITGASSGIGQSCYQYLSQKHTVYGTSRKSDNCADPFMLQLDITDPKSIANAVGVIIEKEGRLDVLINNAGISVVGSAEFTDPSEIKKIFDTNFWGTVNMTHAVLPKMRNQKEGLIINIGSLMGLFAIPFQAYYAASKHALEGYVESLRMEIKDQGIRATIIEPGDFFTAIGDHRIISELHPEQNSPYHYNLDKTLEIISKGELEGDNPIKIAKLVEKIIHKKNPKVRYSIGKPLDVAAAKLKRLLPQKVFEWLIMDHYNI
ncbi:MAG: SDR family oxidoreductase [Reichenbachiella sp.]